jgi:hypothetical protein
VHRNGYHQFRQEVEDSHGHRWVVYLPAELNRKAKALAKARKINVAHLRQMIVQSTASPCPLQEKSMKMFQVVHDGTKVPIGPCKATTMYARDPYPPATPPYFEIHFGGTRDTSVRYQLELDRLELIHFVQDQLATLLMSQGEISAAVLRDKIDEALF